MLHRSSHTLPWSFSKAGEPSDLPDVLREDLLLVVPLNPLTLFVTWYISYPTQNKLIELLRQRKDNEESSLNNYRLILSITFTDPRQSNYKIDISGPSRTRYIPIVPPRLEDGSELNLFASLGFSDKQNNFYAVNATGPILLPGRYLSSIESFYHRPQTQLYERLYRRLRPMNGEASNPEDICLLSQLIDQEFGRSRPPSVEHSQDARV